MKLLYSEHPTISTAFIRDLRIAFRHYKILVTDHADRTSELVRADAGRIITKNFTILNRNYRVIEVVMPREFVIRADEYPALSLDECLELHKRWETEWGCHLKATIAGDWGSVKVVGARFQIIGDEIIISEGAISATVPMKGYWWIKLAPYVDSD